MGIKTKVTGLAGLALVITGCGSAEVPEVIYERALNSEKYLACMVEYLSINETCRFQRDERVFDACMTVHHRNCVELATEMVKGGVQ